MKKSTVAFARTSILMLFLIMSMFFLVGCTQKSEQNIPYQMYQGTEMTTTTIAHTNQGYNMDQIVIKKNVPDNYKIAQQNKKMKEEADKYKTLSKVWDEENLRKEEGNQYEEQFRIEAYCRENGFLKCKKITETCDEDGCRKVTIKCNDKGFDEDDLRWNEYDPGEECDDYQVEVSDVTYDDPYYEKKVYETVII